MSLRHNANWVGTTVAAAIAFAIGMLISGPLAAFEFNFVFFEDFSIDKVAGTWSNTVQYIAVFLFSVLSGAAFLALPGEWQVSFIVRLPLALLIGTLAMVILVAAIGFIVAVLALIALLLALFFGPGDR